jgi:hypothetical protein
MRNGSVKPSAVCRWQSIDGMHRCGIESRETWRMSYDPMNPPPQRPRSTPIPGSGPELPPPTPAQFLNEPQQQLPWTPQPGNDVNAQMGFSAAPGFVPTTGSSIRAFVWILVLVIFGVTGLVGWLIYKSATDAVNDAVDKANSEQPFNTLQVPIPPSFTISTVPPVTVIAPPVTIGPASIPTNASPATVVPGSVPPVSAETVPIATVAQDTTTLPTPPPTVLPTPPPTVLPTPPPTVLPTPPPTPTFLPNGATVLFDEGAARFVADQLDLAMAGEPTQFTEIILFPDNALATAQDPANPSQIVAAQWRDGSIAPADVTSTGGSGNLSSELFTGGDVNWEAINSLVAFAPAVLNLTDGHVTYVTVDRVGTGNPPPVVIDVYVEGPSGKGYVEASASGEILSSGPVS